MNNKLSNINNDNTSNEKILKRISFYLFLIVIFLVVIIFRLEKFNNNFTLLTNGNPIELSTNEKYDEILDVFFETTHTIGDNLPLYNENEDTKTTTTTAKDKGNINGTTSTSSNSTGKITYVINKNSKKMHYKTCSFVNRMKEENKIIIQLNKEELNSYLKNGYTLCSTCGG